MKKGPTIPAGPSSQSIALLLIGPTRRAREAADAAAKELAESAMATAFELSALYKRRAKRKVEETAGGGGGQGE